MKPVYSAHTTAHSEISEKITMLRYDKRLIILRKSFMYIKQEVSLLKNWLNNSYSASFYSISLSHSKKSVHVCIYIPHFIFISVWICSYTYNWTSLWGHVIWLRTIDISRFFISMDSPHYNCRWSWKLSYKYTYYWLHDNCLTYMARCNSSQYS